jgi:hypothetical protein
MDEHEARQGERQGERQIGAEEEPMRNNEQVEERREMTEDPFGSCPDCGRELTEARFGNCPRCGDRRDEKWEAYVASYACYPRDPLGELRELYNGLDGERQAIGQGLGTGHPLCRLVDGALRSGDLDELLVAQAAIIGWPNHVVRPAGIN